MNDVSEKIIKIISVIGEMENEKLDENTLLKDIGINSISFIKIVVNIEQELNIEFGDDDLDVSKFNTLSELIAVVKNKVAP